MTSEELARALLDNSERHFDCTDKCDLRASCERVRHLYDADGNLCTAFATLFRILNEGKE